jgi:hypothetical protein
MKRSIILFPIALVLLIVFTTVNAQRNSDPAAPQSGYDLSWYTIGSGGATFSTGGSYSLGGTIGQADAGSMSGGTYQLAGGFWGGAIAHYNIYLPLILRN